MRQICDECESIAEIILSLTTMDGEVLDRIQLCIPCATQAHVSKFKYFTFSDIE